MTEQVWKLDEDERAQRDDVRTLVQGMQGGIQNIRQQAENARKQADELDKRADDMSEDLNFRVIRLLRRLAKTRDVDPTRLQPKLKDTKEGDLVVCLDDPLNIKEPDLKVLAKDPK